MTQCAPEITFTRVTHDDLPVLAAWVRSAHWRDWWGDPDAELGYIVDMIEGRDPNSHPFLFRVDGVPMGFIQYWHIGPHQTEEWIEGNPWLEALPAHAIGVDLSIGPPERLAQGLGSRVLRQFVERLRTEGHDWIIIDPDPANARAVRAYEKAGFRTIPELVGCPGGSLIMRHEFGVEGVVP